MGFPYVPLDYCVMKKTNHDNTIKFNVTVCIYIGALITHCINNQIKLSSN